VNHPSKQENVSYFHFNVRSLGKNQHKLNDFFLMTNVNPAFISISETKLKIQLHFECWHLWLQLHSWFFTNQLRWSGYLHY